MFNKVICLISLAAALIMAQGASADLIGHWLLDGDGKDASGNGLDGTVNGNVVPTADRSGKPDSAMQFGGTSADNVDIGDPPALQLTGAMTLAAWVWLDSSNTNNARIFAKAGGGGARSWSLNIEASSGGVSNPATFQISATGASNISISDSEPLPTDQWVHMAGVYRPGEATELYVNGQLKASNTSGIPASQFSDNGRSVLIGSRNSCGNCGWLGAIDDVRIYDEALTAAGIIQAMIGVPPGAASDPSPADEATDVPLDTLLGWTPGEFAPAINGHTVYFGDNFNDVNDGLGGLVQSAATYAPNQRLELETTYYWRVDEVNGPPDYSVHPGNVWSFTTEPVAYPIANVTATASSIAPEQGPASATVDGSGLSDDLHSTDTKTMWLSNAAGPQPTWIQFEFDRVYVLHEMWVWNSNTSFEQVIGYGFRDVTVEYSLDGIDYTTLGTTHEFARATGKDDYAHNTTVDFGGVQAQYVRLTPNSNWTGYVPQFGLSEVRFLHIPVRARKPSPASGATDVSVDTTLAWRAGRQAAEHNVYVSTDEQAVIDGTAPFTIMSEASYSPSVDLGSTYYWRVDEVNNAETPAMWQGDVWNFSTQEYLVVDDFESYNDIEAGQEGSNLVYDTWVDGYGSTTNGSTIGYDVPFEPTMEFTIVHGGHQSAPMAYDNRTATMSEVARTFAAQDWTANGILTLSIWFYGDPASTPGQLYVKINGVQVNYPGAAAKLSRPMWQRWDIDLSTVGTNLQSVTSLAIGVQGLGATGTLLLDDIGLYRTAPALPEEIWLEAEAAGSITPPMKVYNDPAASGGMYIGTDVGIGNETDAAPADGVATYSFTVQGGVYKIVGRVIIPDGDSFWVRIVGVTDLTPGEDPDQPGTGWVRWSDPPNGDEWHWEDVFSGDHGSQTANWTLAAGTYTLEIARREDGALLDAILITSDFD